MLPSVLFCSYNDQKSVALEQNWGRNKPTKELQTDYFFKMQKAIQWR